MQARKLMNLMVSPENGFDDPNGTAAGRRFSEAILKARRDPGNRVSAVHSNGHADCDELRNGRHEPRTFARTGRSNRSLQPASASVRNEVASMPYSCLIIERHPDAGATAARALPAFGFRPFVARSAERALGILSQWRFDAALVDADGFGAGYVDVLRELRPQFRSPVILLSTSQSEAQQILSLECGATEVVIKPASPRLLAAKMQRLIEVVHDRTEPPRERLQFGPLSMHAGSGLARVDDTALDLTPHQFDLLFLLASNAGRFVDRESIALRLRGSTRSIGRSIDVHVYRIRRKLRECGIDSLRLDTVHGRGYLLTWSARAAANADARAEPRDTEPVHFAKRA
jgi:DNA-binding response OmpR family regulator